MKLAAILAASAVTTASAHLVRHVSWFNAMAGFCCQGTSVYWEKNMRIAIGSNYGITAVCSQPLYHNAAFTLWLFIFLFVLQRELSSLIWCSFSVSFAWLVTDFCYISCSHIMMSLIILGSWPEQVWQEFRPRTPSKVWPATKMGWWCEIRLGRRPERQPLGRRSPPETTFTPFLGRFFLLKIR